MTIREFYNERLHDMLTYMRPHDTQTELDWGDRLFAPYDYKYLGRDQDNLMAYVITVPNPDASPCAVMFSAHTDTVHRKEGRQKLVFDQAKNRYKKKDGQPLGADNGAGVWLLLEMIDAKVPGTYVFHRGEECGGIGSRWISEHVPAWCKQFDFAVAFDRKATDSVITHQMVGRTCSEDFANALCDALNNVGDFMYSPDDTGSFTDTASYIDHIGECTNVSVGYYSEHTAQEELDVKHLFALRDACIKLDWQALPVTRVAGTHEAKKYTSYGGFGSRFASMDDFDWDTYLDEKLTVFDLDHDDLLNMATDDPDSFVKEMCAIVKDLGQGQGLAHYARQSNAQSISTVSSKPFAGFSMFNPADMTDEELDAAIAQGQMFS
jgi:hypothetical protein